MAFRCCFTIHAKLIESAIDPAIKKNEFLIINQQHDAYVQKKISISRQQLLLSRAGNEMSASIAQKMRISFMHFPVA